MNRWTSGIFVALCGWLPALVHAQGPWQPPGVQSAGFHAPAGGAEAYCPPGYGYGGGPYDGLVPSGHGIAYDHDSRFDLSFHEALARSYVRLDYLMWDISDPGSRLLGAPPPGDFDLSGRTPSERLPAVDPINGPRQLTSAVVPNLSFVDQSHLSGIRGTWGIPTNIGILEANIWTLQPSRQELVVDPFVDSQIAGLPQTLIGAVTLTNNGTPSNTTMILFSEGYEAGLKTTFWGTEGNWIFNPFVPNIPLEVSPIVGFRYMQLTDRLTIQGTDISSTGLQLDHYIGSLARNQIFGPQVGLKFDHIEGCFELVTETKFIFGINRLNESVRTEQIYSPTEAPVTDSDTRTRFAPIFDLAITGKIHMSERFCLYAGYELLIGGGFSRSYDNILYDAPTNVTTPPRIRLDAQLQKFIAHGLVIGGELVFR